EPASRAPVVGSDIVDPPSRGGLRGAEEAVLECGGELPQGGHRGVGLLQQCGGGAVGRLPVQRAQQVARIPAVDAGAQRDQRGAQLGGGCHVRQPVQGQASLSSWNAIERGRVVSVSSSSSSSSGWIAAW